MGNHLQAKKKKNEASELNLLYCHIDLWISQAPEL